MNKRVFRASLFFAIVTADLAATPAMAVEYVRGYEIAATFIQAAAPVRSLTLNFSLTYDPLVAYTDRALTTYQSSSSAAQFNSPPVVFSTQPGLAGGTILTIGGGPFGTQYAEGTDDFFAQILVDGTGNVLPWTSATVEYSFRGFRATYNTRLLAVTRTDLPGTGSGVPEPASWAMMIAGFGLAGAGMRRRRQAMSAIC